MVKTVLPKWRHTFSTSGTTFSTTNNKNSFYKPFHDDIPKLPRPPCSPIPRISPKQSTEYRQQRSPPNNSKKNNTTASRDDDNEELTPPNLTPIPTTTITSSSSILFQPMSLVEIQGMSLLEERDDCRKELQQANRIMYFHALQLIRKQKQWLKLASSSCSFFPPLSTHGQRQMALEELETKIIEATSHENHNGMMILPPEKALFKATALLEDSMSCFFLKYYDSKRNVPTVTTITTTPTDSSVVHLHHQARSSSSLLAPPVAPAAAATMDHEETNALLKLCTNGTSSTSCSDVYYDMTVKGGGTVVMTSDQEGMGNKANAKPAIIFTDDDDEYEEWMKSMEEQRRKRLVKTATKDDTSEQYQIESINKVFAEFDEWKKVMDDGIKFPAAVSIKDREQEEQEEEQEEEEQQSTETTADSILEGSDHYFLQFDDWMKDLQGREAVGGSVGTTALVTHTTNVSTAFRMTRIEI
jgi:hypothetical protein